MTELVFLAQKAVFLIREAVFLVLEPLIALRFARNLLREPLIVVLRGSEK